MADDDGGNLWDELIDDLRDLWNGGGDDELVHDMLHEMVVDGDMDALHEAIYAMTDDPSERHELWTAAMYE